MRPKRLTAQRILRDNTDSKFLAEMRATGLRGKALKLHTEQERKKLAEIRLQNIQYRAISMR
jgi:hypothetical protein